MFCRRTVTRPSTFHLILVFHRVPRQILAQMVPAATDGMLGLLLNEGKAYSRGVKAFKTAARGGIRPATGDDTGAAAVDVSERTLPEELLTWQVEHRGADKPSPVAEVMATRQQQTRLLQAQSRAAAAVKVGSVMCKSAADVGRELLTWCL